MTTADALLLAMNVFPNHDQLLAVADELEECGEIDVATMIRNPSHGQYHKLLDDNEWAVHGEPEEEAFYLRKNDLLMDHRFSAYRFFNGVWHRVHRRNNGDKCHIVNCKVKKLPPLDVMRLWLTVHVR